VLVLWLLGWALFIAPACASPVQYFYDENGRLVAVIDNTSSQPANNMAVYAYDQAGNLVSITRRPSSTASVLSLQPDCGSAGTSVTINGTGFSTTASQDSVSFAKQGGGTVPASITSVSANQIVVTVPTGATSGTVQVTVTPSSGSPRAANPPHCRTEGAESKMIDFENPPYTTGSIDGQDGLSATGPCHYGVVATSGFGSPGGPQLSNLAGQPPGAEVILDWASRH